VTIDIDAVKQHGAFYSSAFNQVVQPVEASQQRGFSAAGWPNERRDLIFYNLNINFEERLVVAIKEIDLWSASFTA
jgi:hypothetical protein